MKLFVLGLLDFKKKEHVEQGIGTKLLEKLDEEAQKNGIDSIHLRSLLNSVDFYEKAGYKAKEKTKYRLTDKVQLDSISIEKELNRKYRKMLKCLV